MPYDFMLSHRLFRLKQRCQSGKSPVRGQLPVFRNILTGRLHSFLTDFFGMVDIDCKQYPACSIFELIPISNTSATKVPEEIEAWRSRPAKRPFIYLPIELSSGKKSKAISTSVMNCMVTMVVLAE